MKFLNVVLIVFLFVSLVNCYEVDTTKLHMIESKLTGVDLISSQPIYSVATPTETTHYYYAIAKTDGAKSTSLTITPNKFTLKEYWVMPVAYSTYSKTINYTEEKEVFEKELLEDEMLEEKNQTKEETKIILEEKQKQIQMSVFEPLQVSKTTSFNLDGQRYLILITTKFGEQGSFNPDVSACAELNESNGIYNLTQNVSIDGATCFTITAPNVTLDCNGYSITGNNSSSTYGVYSNQLNTTVKNCNISNFYNGIQLNGAANAVISNNTVTNTYNGRSAIALYTSNFANVSNNTVSGVVGISVQTNSNNNQLNNNQITTSSSNGIHIDSGVNNSVDCFGSSITGSNTLDSYGIYSTQLNTTVKNCVITGFKIGIFGNTGSSYILADNNTINATVAYYPRAIFLSNSPNALLKNNRLYMGVEPQATTSGFGVVSSNASNLVMQNNSYSSPFNGTGVFITNGALNNNISNFTMNISGSPSSGDGAYNGFGIYANSGSNMSIDCQGASITGSNSSSTYGIYSTQLNTTIKNCQISNFSTGIYINGDGADYANITNNTINLTYATSCSLTTGACNGIYLVGSDNSTIARNNVSAYQFGIDIRVSADENQVLNNTIAVANGNAISVVSSSLNKVDKNTINSTGDLSIYLYTFAVNNNITNNIVNTTYRAMQVQGKSNNNFIANNSLNVAGGASTTIRFYDGSSNNTIVNNTLFSTSSGEIISLSSTAGGNLFYQNNLSGSIWLSDLDGTNLFNSSGIGNIYYFANGTPSWEVYAIYTNDSDNWADYGANRPFNSSIAQWSGSGNDWHPYTLNTNYSIRITQNVSFTNATVGHWFYANATAYNPSGYNQSSNISASSGTCSLVSSTETNWTLAVVYNCTAQTPSTSLINITFFDVYGVRNSTHANNSYPDPNMPILTAPFINGTQSVGYTLTCNAGNFSDADGDIENVSATTWRWFNGTTPIANATSQTWLVPLWYNGAVIKCEQNVTAQNWTTSQASNNSSAVTISNANPVNATLENMINATTSHQFNITAYADDADGGQDITVWNLTSTHGTCSFLSNTTGGNRRTVLINCYADSEGTTELNVTFADFNGLYNWTAQNFTFVDHPANLSAPYITPISNNTLENLTCNIGNWSDIDNDTENVSARAFRWFVNGVYINVTDQVLYYGNFSNGNTIICEQFSIAENWSNSNATVNSTAVYISNQSVNLVISSPSNGSLINACNLTTLIFTGFENGTTNRTATCNLSYNGDFINTITQNVSNGFSTFVFSNLTNNGNYSVTCQAQDSSTVSAPITVYTQFYDMVACYAKVYGTITTEKNTTAVYTEVTIPNFNVRSILGIMIIGLAIFGLVSYSERLGKMRLFTRLWR